MPVIAVVNRKGGSGKSTLATHLAGYCANQGLPVMLGDVDRQQSTQTWLRLRDGRPVAQRSPILGWVVDPKNVLRAPAGISHVVLDTPGGMQGFELARMAVFADAILMPVCNSVFDRESAAECYAELKTLPRVVSGRCKVAAVGMRLDAHTQAAGVLKEWAGRLGLPFIGSLRETQGYVKCIEQGLTLFDVPAPQVEIDLAQWEPILQWLQPVLYPAAPPVRAAEAATSRQPQRNLALGVSQGNAEPPQDAWIPAGGAARPSGRAHPVPGGTAHPQPLPAVARSLVPAGAPAATLGSQEMTASALLATTGRSVLNGSALPRPSELSLATRLGRFLGTLPIPGFMQRHL
jgi:chromosome partitioning protein